MGRVSNRTRIVEAALRVAERDGSRGVTLESVAAEAGLTKGGVQYHFDGKDQLMAAIELDIWTRAADAATIALGKPVHESSADERLEALIRSSADQTVRAGELQLVLDSARAESADSEGQAFFARWTGADERPLTAGRWVALLASDGLWLHDSLGEPLEGETREAVVTAIIELVRRDASSSELT